MSGFINNSGLGFSIGGSSSSSSRSSDSSDVRTRLVKFDGQDIFNEAKEMLFRREEKLGEGSFGQVFTYTNIETGEIFAIKQLKPVNLQPQPGVVKKSETVVLIRQGVRPAEEQVRGNCIHRENISWYYHRRIDKFIAAYEDRTSTMREINLCMCMHIFGLSPFGEIISEEAMRRNATEGDVVEVNGNVYTLPNVPPSYVAFLMERQKFYLEIRNMAIVSGHSNIVSFIEMLEWVEATRSHFFIVQDYASGGTLLDYVKNESIMPRVASSEDLQKREMIAKRLFYQLLLGLKHCHNKGIAHRDLKCENVLLSATSENPILLKICDFGFSKAMFNEIFSHDTAGNNSSNSGSVRNSNDNIALFMDSPEAPTRARANSNLSSNLSSPSSPPTNSNYSSLNSNSLIGINLNSPSNLDEEIVTSGSPGFFGSRQLSNMARLHSLVGTETYTAPEINKGYIDANAGYIGSCVDMWSSGVILFVIVAGDRFPFGQDIATCEFYKQFQKWCQEDDNRDFDASRTYPNFFRASTNAHGRNPIYFSPALSDLLVSLLHPKPERRLSAEKALCHHWFDDLNLDFLGPQLEERGEGVRRSDGDGEGREDMLGRAFSETLFRDLDISPKEGEDDS